MYKNYIFDFGKVIVEFEPQYMTKQYIKDENEIKLAQDIIFDRVYWDRLDAGTISDSEVIEGIKSRLPESLHESAIKVYKNWYYNIPFIEGMPELIKAIKAKGGKLFLLSNISVTFAENYTKVAEIAELFSLFDGLVFSAPIGMVKPTPQIFEHLLSKYKLDAKDCIFIDDNANNIMGAESVGIKGYLFDGDAKSLKSVLL